LGAILVATLGPASAFGFDGFTFIVSALSLFLIHMPVQNASLQKMLMAQEEGSEETSIQPVHKGIQGMVADVREGLEYVATSTWLKATIIIPAFGNAIFGGGLTIAFPRLVHDVYGTGVWLVGAYATAEALGFIGATVFTGQVHLRKRGMLAFIGPLLSCVAFIVLGLPLPHGIAPTIAIIASVCSGFGIGMLQMIWVTLLHQLVPNDKLGRVGSIDLLGSLGLLPVGFAVIGILTDKIGPALIFIVGGSICLILYSIPLFLRDIRSIE
jgi:MFS family permease